VAFSNGERLGPYEIVSLIGSGGMGDVYKAHDTRLGRDVAIKVSTLAFNERFEREGRAVAALNHPNICQLYDVGALPSGVGFLVMEHIEGERPPSCVRAIECGIRLYGASAKLTPPNSDSPGRDRLGRAPRPNSRNARPASLIARVALHSEISKTGPATVGTRFESGFSRDRRSANTRYFSPLTKMKLSISL
jgi:hypothetical protein